MNDFIVYKQFGYSKPALVSLSTIVGLFPFTVSSYHELSMAYKGLSELDLFSSILIFMIFLFNLLAVYLIVRFTFAQIYICEDRIIEKSLFWTENIYYKDIIYVDLQQDQYKSYVYNVKIVGKGILRWPPKYYIISGEEKAHEIGSEIYLRHLKYTERNRR